ncbi:MAG: SigE family RNA polymerase sigma factor [Actinomycetota bacterium]
MERTEARPSGRMAELYRTHAPAAARLAFLMTGDAARAEDLVHDAFVKVIGRFGDIRDPDAFGAYLKRTVVNLANSYFRRRRLEREHLEAEGRAYRDEPAGERDPVEREHLWKALGTLPPRQRAAIVLRFYEDLSEQQTAYVLGVPVGTVKSMVSRGLDALRTKVER